MSDIAKAYVQIEPTFNGVSGKISQAFGGAGEEGGKSFAGGFGKVVSGAGKVVAGAIATGTAAVGAFAVSAVQAGASFDSSMAQVAATMGTTVDEIGNLRDFAQEMGSTTAFSATEAADALNYMALAGYDAETSMAMLPNVLNLASAGGIELARASDMVTDAASALGLTLEDGSVDVERTTQMVDQMAKASSKSNTSVEQLGDAFLTIGATARSAQGGTQELATMLGVMADNGIKGSEAGTHLRNIMLAMNPTTDKAAAAWEQLGVEAYDANGELRALPDVFQDLSAAMDGMTDQQKTETLSAMFNKTDLATVNALLGTTSQRYEELSDAIGDSKDAASEMATTQLANLSGDITLFKSALEGAQIAVSDQLTPTLREFVQFGAKGLSQLTQSFKEGGLEGAMAAFGELLSSLITKVVGMLPSLITAGMQLISALGQGIMQNLPMITQAAIQIITMLAQYIIEALPTLIEAAAQIILQLATGIAEALPTLIPTIVEVILTIVMYLLENIDLLIDAAIQLIMGLAQGLINALPILIEKAPEIIMAIVNGLITNIPKLLAAALQLIIALGQGLIQNLPLLKQKGIELITNLKNALVEAAKKLTEVGKSLVEGIKKGISDAWDGFRDWVLGLLNGMVDAVKAFFGIGSPSKLMADEIGQWIPAGIAKGIEDGMDVLNSAVGDMSTDVVMGAQITASDIPQTMWSQAEDDEHDALYELLAAYLPGIASNSEHKIVLEGGLDRLFRAMQRESARNSQIVGPGVAPLTT